MKNGPHIQKARTSIWIIGDSLLMAGIAASFEERTTEKPVRWATVEKDMETRLQAARPNLIIFELNTPGAYLLLDMLREYPGTQLLGIDHNCDQVILMNSTQRPTRTMGDLYRIVQEAAGFREDLPKGEQP